MAEMHVEIDQAALRRLLKNIDRYGEYIKRQIQDEITYTAQEIRTESVASAPVDTGRLKKSGYVNMRHDRLGAKIGHNANYATYVEFGTSKQRPQPFLVPAFDRNTRKMKNAIHQIINNRKNKFRPR